MARQHRGQVRYRESEGEQHFGYEKCDTTRRGEARKLGTKISWIEIDVRALCSMRERGKRNDQGASEREGHEALETGCHITVLNT